MSSALVHRSTSVGLAYALSRRLASDAMQCLLEVNSVADARDVLGRLDLSRVELFSRSADNSHLEDMERRLSAIVTANATIVLTGKAASIQRLRRGLNALGILYSMFSKQALRSLNRATLRRAVSLRFSRCNHSSSTSSPMSSALLRS
jgi:hypothetical protein